jgi:N4-gp56 family major capsid protein
LFDWIGGENKNKMAEALNRTTGGLSVQMMTYYEKVFLARAKNQLVYAEGAQKSTHGKNSGKSIVFTRMTPMSNVTTALSEGANPAVVLLAGANVSCTLAEYGNTAKVTKFLSLTSIDRNNAQSIELLGQNMGDTIDYLAGTALSVGGDTALWANSKKASSLASSDTMDAADIREAIEALEVNKAPAYSDGFYIAKVNPKVKTSIVKDSTWINAKTYSDVKDLYNGEMGELYQARFLMSTQALSSTGSKASYTDAYLTFFHGKDALGTYDLEGDQPKLYVLTNPVDSYSPTGRYALISWAGSYVAKVLNSDWVQVMKVASG